MSGITIARESLLFFPFLLLLPVVFLFLKLIKRPNSSRLPLPPGPRPWPIIGNLLSMGKKPHITLDHLAQVHGPLVSLRLGTQLLVVASSPATATEILKTHDRLLAARYVPKITPHSVDRNDISLVWQSECGERWKFFRTICRTGLFSTKAVDGQSQVREKKVAELVSFLTTKEGEVVKVAEAVFATVFNILGNLFFSRDFIELDEKEGVAEGLKGLIWRMMELGTTPNIADFYPILAGLDLQGLNKKALQCVKRVHGVWDALIKERKEGKDKDALRQCDFLDILLDNELTADQISNLILELFTAGTDTSTSTIEWAMTELIKNPDSMKKVREELQTEFKEKKVRESNLDNLHYLQACVKETMRLHPPVPLLLPHRASDACEIMNYTIPKNSQVQVNVWAIGRDPTRWTNAQSFTPDRFLNSELDYKGNDFEFIPFGAGRRICPGLPMATRQVHLILASLVHYFEWSLPCDTSSTQLDMNEKFGVTLQKEQPLLLIPKLRR